MRLDTLSYRSLQWLVFLFLAAHNLEEGLTAPSYLPRVKAILNGRVPAGLIADIPTPGQLYAALAGATIIPFFIVLFATSGRPSPFKDYTVAVVQALVLVNVFVPHVPAAILLGGYAPGVVTAVLLNLPFSLYFFSRSLREGHVTRKGLVVMLVSALPLLLLSVRALYALGGSVSVR